MGDPTNLNGGLNGAAALPFWQRVTLKQVAGVTALSVLILLGIGLIIALRYVCCCCSSALW